MHKFFIIILFAILSGHAALHHHGTTNTDTAPDTTQEINKARLIGFSTFAVITTSTLFYSFLKVAWWDKEQRDFYFRDDLKYALNIDKVAHFYGGYGIASLTADGLLWSKTPPHWAYGTA